MQDYGGKRDCTKYQIFFASSPSVNERIYIICYHCNEPIVKEHDERYVVVAGAGQRPLYFHDDDCYEGFLNGMTLFFNHILTPVLNEQEPEIV